MNQDLIYLRAAYDIAVGESTDPRTQNGAILLSQNKSFVADANHFPKDVQETPERWEKPLKNMYVEHAERNVIFAAARRGISTYDAIMYVPWFACPDCARAIVQAGIKRVVGHAAPFHVHPDWQPLIDIADTILREAGVDFVRIEHTFNKFTILFDGVVVTP